MFNIIGFGSNFVKLFPSGSVEYNEKNLKTALEHCKKLNADLGGTNILSPLQAIFAEPAKSGIPRQLFILTDGEVENTNLCIQTVKKQAKTTRVFTFGIGSGASFQLVDGLSKAGNGSCEMIHDNSDMEEKLMRQLSRAAKIGVTDIKVDWTVKGIQSPYE